MSETPRYPEADVKLSTYPDAFISLGRVRLALREAGAPPKVIDEFSNEALDACCQEDFIEICRKWVTVR